MKKSKSIIKLAGLILLVITLLLGGFVGFLTIREYRPDAVEQVDFPENSRMLSVSDPITLLTMNTGYGGLSEHEDFFMDGGEKVRPDDKDTVLRNLQGMTDIMKEHKADVYFLQEVDQNAKRSYSQNEIEYYEKALGIGGTFAYNFNCDFVPYPLPFIGPVESGLLTMTDMNIAQSQRISLPESFSWPVKTCNLKRCLLKTSIPLKDTTAELVLVNLHLEAYDSGAGKIAQSKELAGVLEEEYKKGNYVIAGGDFNQLFDNVEQYPVWNTENWNPGTIAQSSLPDGFRFATDNTYPTCRLLDAPYTASYETSQVYVIDGFIVSPNVKVENVAVINQDFEFTDHQPVKLSVSLIP